MNHREPRGGVSLGQRGARTLAPRRFVLARAGSCCRRRNISLLSPPQLGHSPALHCRLASLGLLCRQCSKRKFDAGLLGSVGWVPQLADWVSAKYTSSRLSVHTRLLKLILTEWTVCAKLSSSSGIFAQSSRSFSHRKTVYWQFLQLEGMTGSWHIMRGSGTLCACVMAGWGRDGGGGGG